MPSVDWHRLNELRDDIGEEDFADVALLFVAELQETIGAMDRATASAADFHFLRGSAANLGFVGLVEACSNAEAACDSGGRPDVEAVKAAFAIAIEQLEPEFPDLVVAA